MKILAIGHAAYDITIPVSSFPVENTKNRVSKRVECGGGPASNAAYLLGKWGMDVSFAGIVGNDEYGIKIKEEFESVKVNTKYLELSKEHPTTSSFIVANTSNGSRTILTYRPDDMHLSKLNLDFTPDIIFMDGQEYQWSKELIKKYPNAITIIDAGRATPEIIELSKMVNYIVCSHEFAEIVTGLKIDYNDTKSLIAVYHAMEKLFKGQIVITLEATGSVYKIDNLIKLMPSIKVQAVDSTGAGDIFHGAFTYGIANNMPYEYIIKMSNIAGALSVTKIGSRYSVPTKDEMKEKIDDFR